MTKDPEYVGRILAMAENDKPLPDEVDHTAIWVAYDDDGKLVATTSSRSEGTSPFFRSYPKVLRIVTIGSGIGKVVVTRETTGADQ